MHFKQMTIKDLLTKEKSEITSAQRVWRHVRWLDAWNTKTADDNISWQNKFGISVRVSSVGRDKIKLSTLVMVNTHYFILSFLDPIRCKEYKQVTMQNVQENRGIPRETDSQQETRKAT